MNNNENAGKACTDKGTKMENKQPSIFDLIVEIHAGL
jgi:hypothetical protein